MKLRIDIMKRIAMKRTIWIIWAFLGLLSLLSVRMIYVQNSLDFKLIFAAKRLDGAALKTYLADGANPDATDPETRHPLWLRILAHLSGQSTKTYDGDPVLLVVFKSCIERESIVSANKTIGTHELMTFEPTDIVCALLDKDANANVQIAPGLSAISYAQGCGYKRCVRILLEHDASANGEAFGGGTLLSYAIHNDDFDTAKELMRHGANENAIGTNGLSPLGYAISSGSSNYAARQRIIKLLNDSGAH